MLVGIVTETEIYTAFVHMLGKGKDDRIITLRNVRLTERIGAMSRIASIIEGLKVPVLAMFSMPMRRKPGNRLFIRVQASDTAPIERALEEKGYKVGD